MIFFFNIEITIYLIDWDQPELISQIYDPDFETMIT
jgi:hypothetical protein